MSRFLSCLAPVALLFVTALGAPACAAVTDAPDSADVIVQTGAPQIKVVTVDAADLDKEAANLERISADLRSVIARVDAVSAEMTSRLQGQAGVAAQQARIRFGEAATRQLRELDGVRDAVDQSAGRYHDDEEDLGLHQAMGFRDAQFNFGAIEASLGEIQGSAAQIAMLREEASASITRLAAVWGGAGSESYATVQMRWNASSMELDASVQNLANVLRMAVDSMNHTERGTAGMFAG